MPDTPNGGSQPLTLLLVDDHELVRAGVRLLLESCLGHSVIEAASALEALEIVRDEAVDLVFLDAFMPEHDGLWALERIRAERPELPVLILSTFNDPEYVRRALSAGAAGYVLKEAGVQQVADAIKTALDKRGVYLHPIVARRVLDQQRDDIPDRLTERELDVIRLLVEGATNDDIATHLFVTEKTVKTHLSAIFRKLGVTNRTQAATKAMRDGLGSVRSYGLPN